MSLAARCGGGYLSRLDLPEVDRVLFRKAPLVLTVAQVKYPAAVRFGEQASLADLQEELANEYPIATKEQQVVLTVNIGGVEQSPGSSQLWRFSTPDRNWSVVVGQDAVTLEVRSYVKIEHFCDKLLRILGAIKQHIRPTYQLRLGLRYINEFRHEGAATMETWKELLNPDMLGLSALYAESVDHSYHEIRARFDDAVLVIRHGLLHGSIAPVPGTSPGNNPYYLLDMDYFDETPVPWDSNRVIGQVREWNEVMYRLFRWAMSERLFKALEPHHA
jgi:uncharacterized protein (TIGR04255 family)